MGDEQTAHHRTVAWKEVARDRHEWGKQETPPLRIDWDSIKDRINLVTVAESLLGPPAKREGRRLLWSCPFHDDHHPSFGIDLKWNRWRCWTCGIGGDAVDLVKRVLGGTFPEIALIVAGLSGIPDFGDGPPPAPRPMKRFVKTPDKPASPPPAQPSGLPLDQASVLAFESVRRLWEPRGESALAYLHRRGLTDKTIEAARIGWTPRVVIPTQNGYWDVQGITIPWFDRDRLTKINIRRPQGSKPKYAEAFRDRPLLYPDPAIIQVGAPLIIVEGEFEQMLLSQELPEASIITLGSAYNSADSDIYPTMMRAPTWYIALDADQAGANAASKFPEWATRVQPPQGFKDWTELWQLSPDRVRHHWSHHLEGIYAVDERRAIQEESALPIGTERRMQ